MNAPFQNCRGLVDDTLDFFVTSIQLSAAATKSLPDWIHPQIPKPRFGPQKRRLPELEKIRETETFSAHTEDFNRELDQWLGEFGQTSSGVHFLGPLERASAINLDQDLSLIGIVPRSFSLYIKRIRDDSPTYRLNIRWDRRPLESSAESFEMIQKYKNLFWELQLQYAWQISGIEFKNSHKGYRCVVLDFRGREHIVPSLRWGNVGIKDYKVVTC